MQVSRAATTALCVLAACLSACSAPPRRPSPAPSVPLPAATANAVHGRAYFPDGALLARDASFDALLVGERADGSAPSVLARVHYADLHAPVLDFDLPYDSARVDGHARYRLRASLRDAHGRLQFVTRSAVDVLPGDSRRIDVRLVRAEAATARVP